MMTISSQLPGGSRVIQWHVGEDLAQITGRVVTFQADGDELALILTAMRQGFFRPPPANPTQTAAASGDAPQTTLQEILRELKALRTDFLVAVDLIRLRS